MNAYDVVAKAAKEVSSMTKDKVEKVEGEKKVVVLSYQKGATSIANKDFADHVKF